MLTGVVKGDDELPLCLIRTQVHVVLATSIAESSLTIPDVEIVIDSGWTKNARSRSGGHAGRGQGCGSAS